MFRENVRDEGVCNTNGSGVVGGRNKNKRRSITTRIAVNSFEADNCSMKSMLIVFQGHSRISKGCNSGLQPQRMMRDALISCTCIF
jgi:phage replication-related protein YjqB (UPF0714/DUF867 family)